MTQIAADQNLLLGILALQMDFIDRDQLITAMHAWTLEKSRSLGQILLEQATLSQDRLALLENLVHEHLKQHGNDASKSLEAAGAKSVRDEICQIRDPDLRGSLAGMLMGRPSDNGAHTNYVVGNMTFVQGDGAGVGSPTSAGLRFRIISPHAKGGLGEIFIAEDTELKRKVALKEIRLEQAFRPESQARFLLEAEVTGMLEHPGIVPVYGLGTYPDGRPYYAMRFIEGESLREAIQRFHEADAAGRDPGERSLELRKLLARFIEVCNAIEYAHSCGVLHRDLKPENIMLGKYGETLVVDWGLAKRLSRPETAVKDETPGPNHGGTGSSSETQHGSAIGTLAYMSPEQAAGLLERMGPHSDVYSLGATLYVLLSGRPSFDADDDPDVEREQVDLARVYGRELNSRECWEVARDTILRKAREGNSFPRPSAVAYLVPPALDAICMRAMEAQPEDRYPSARALADDLENWLADEPVTAHQESRVQKVARWARRHHGLTAAAAAVLLMIIVFTPISIVQQMRKTEVEREQVRAQKNYDEALGTLNNMFTPLSEGELGNDPELQPLRVKFLEYYQSYIQQNGSQVSDDLAEVYERMAKIIQTIENKSDAPLYYKNAQDIYEKLLQRQPGNIDYQIKVAEIRVHRATVLNDLGNHSNAELEYRQAIKDLDRICAKFPDRLEYLQRRANAYHHLGDLYYGMNRKQDAISALQQGREIREQMVSRSQDRPNHREYWGDLAKSHGYLGDVELDLGHMDRALDSYEQSKEIRGRLFNEKPDDLEMMFQYARSIGNFGNLFGNYGEPDKLDTAIKDYEQALALQEDLVRHNSANNDYVNDLAWTLSILSQLLIDQGELEKAGSYARRAVERAEEVVSRNPKDVTCLSTLVQSHIARAKWLLRTQPPQPAEAAQDLEAAQKTLADLRIRRQHPDDLFDKALVHSLQGDNDEALISLADAVRHGYSKVARVRRDVGLEAIRSSPDFKKLVDQLQNPPK
jgi:serine/threonine protein kinase